MLITLAGIGVCVCLCVISFGLSLACACKHALHIEIVSGCVHKSLNILYCIFFIIFFYFRGEKAYQRFDCMLVQKALTDDAMEKKQWGFLQEFIWVAVGFSFTPHFRRCMFSGNASEGVDGVSASLTGCVLANMLIPTVQWPGLSVWSKRTRLISALSEATLFSVRTIRLLL